MTNSQKKLPTLFHIGVQKAASTLLYNLLDSHPDTKMSSKTEIHFYYKYFEEGFDWYTNLFKEPGIRIDTSPKYFINGEIVAPRIKEALGADTPRFLLMLKNPVDVVNSHFQMNLAQGRFTQHPEIYPVVPKNVIECVELYPTYLEQVKYYQLLQSSWLKYFRRDQFHVEVLERLSLNQNQKLKDIQIFFGLKECKLKASSVSQNKLLRNQSWYKLQGFIAKRPVLKKNLKRSYLANFFFEKIATIPSSAQINKRERAELANLLKSDVAELRKLLNDPLNEWKDFT